MYTVHYTVYLSLALQDAEIRADEARRKAAEGQLFINPSIENRTTFKRHAPKLGSTKKVRDGTRTNNL
jgi:hypothetical protein